MRFEISFDDGVKTDFRAAGIVAKYGLPCTFYIPSVSELTDAEIVAIEAEHECISIGGHTASHPADLKKCSSEMLNFEIKGNKDDLEDIIGKEVTQFCYPRGRYDDRVIEAVKAAGYLEARTTIVMVNDLPTDPYRMHTSIHMFQRDEYLDKSWEYMARKLFDEALQKGDAGYFHLWGHSEELEKYEYWEKFEEFLGYVKEKI